MRYILLLMLAAFSVETAMAQQTGFRLQHKVKRKETVYGISHMYGISTDELMKANPFLSADNYQLRKGDMLNIPWPKEVELKSDNAATTTAEIQMPAKPTEEKDLREREIRIGVMLPLHNVNGDGRRMVEYYRGVLMACDSLRANGISTDIRAWNVSEESDINTFLQDEHAADRDVIIGPLYSAKVKPLSDFARSNGIRLFIPFSINTPELATNPNIFQVYQSTEEQNAAYVKHLVERFGDYHPVIIDCNDSTSKKGPFTGLLRQQLERHGITYDITNSKSSDAVFLRAFSTTKRNLVVLNTGRSPELNIVMAKLNGLVMSNPNVEITLFGYTDWMLYTRHQLENFYKFDTYIPATFYMNAQSAKTKRIAQKYRWNFHADMINMLPRFAITGFDHAYFFIKGLHMYGSNFTGGAGMVGYAPIQTRLNFEQVNPGGGRQNRSVLFVHYTTDRQIETINF